MFMVLSLWQSHCEGSPGSSDECRIAQAAADPQTKPAYVLVAIAFIHHRHFIITQPKTETYFTVLRRVEGWVNPGTRGVRNLPKVSTWQRPCRGSRTPHLRNARPTLYQCCATTPPHRWSFFRSGPDFGQYLKSHNALMDYTKQPVTVSTVN